MKISPLAGSSGSTGENLQSTNTGRTADSMKMERVRAIARGEKVPDAQETQEERQTPSARRIRMRTNFNTNREEDSEVGTGALPSSNQTQAAETSVSSTQDVNEAGTIEDTKPLSPQLAALAKEKRALAERTKAIEAREKALADKPNQDGELQKLKDLIKAKPLSVLQEHGVSYDQLTEAILSGDDSLNPEMQALRAEVQSLKDGVKKDFESLGAQQRKAAIVEIEREAKRLSGGEEFELIRETGNLPKVIELIERIYDTEGELLETSEAMRLVEEELLEKESRIAALKKVQAKLAPQATTPPQRQLRTLTSSGNTQTTLTARQRALMAFRGELKR